MIAVENLDPAPPALRRDVIAAAYGFIGKLGRFNGELFSPEDNRLLYEANFQLDGADLFPLFVGRRLPYTNNWPKFYLKASNECAALNRNRAPFVGQVVLERAEGSDAPGSIQRIWSARYDIDSFRNRCRITRSITGRVVSLAYEKPREVETLLGEQEIGSKFPPKLAVTEAWQLKYLLENPQPTTYQQAPPFSIDFL